MPASDDVSTRLADALRANEKLWECLRRVAALDLPAWYLGAGCVAQTIWNVAHGKAPSADIHDYDLSCTTIGTCQRRANTASNARPESSSPTFTLSSTSRMKHAFIFGI